MLIHQTEKQKFTSYDVSTLQRVGRKVQSRGLKGAYTYATISSLTYWQVTNQGKTSIDDKWRHSPTTLFLFLSIACLQRPCLLFDHINLFLVYGTAPRVKKVFRHSPTNWTTSVRRNRADIRVWNSKMVLVLTIVQTLLGSTINRDVKSWRRPRLCRRR